MSCKYKVIRLMGGWAVVMAANEHILEIFKTEEAAADALTQFENGERFVNEKTDVWVVGNSIVSEPYIGGMQLGEVWELDMNQYNVVSHYTQEEFDVLVEEYFNDHGTYPDT